MAFTVAGVRALLNKWSDRLHPSRSGDVRLGDALCGTEAAGTLAISGISDGDSATYEVPHGYTYDETEGSCTAAAEFIGNLPVPVFEAAEGFRVSLCLEEFTGTSFRVTVTRVGSEYIYGYAGDGSESGGATATLVWTRTGFALPA